MSYYCPICNFPLLRVGECIFYCLNCKKKVGAMVQRNNDEKELGEL